MKQKIFFFIIKICLTIPTLAQHTKSDHSLDVNKQSERGFRIAAVLGHTYISNDGMDGNIYIPSWGLDLDYWFNHTWGIGLHNDVEIENFIVEKDNSEVIERVNPLVFTLDALYHLGSGFVVSIGPGVELDQNESFFLARLGLEFEYDINENVYLMPTLFHDQRFNGYSTTSIGIGLGYKF